MEQSQPKTSKQQANVSPQSGCVRKQADLDTTEVKVTVYPASRYVLRTLQVGGERETEECARAKEAVLEAGLEMDSAWLGSSFLGSSMLKERVRSRFVQVVGVRMYAARGTYPAR